MQQIDICIRYSDRNVRLEKVATLSKESNLIYNDEGGDFKAHIKTTTKFALLTATSPLITVARLIRSVAFVANRDFEGAKREFVGALAAPIVASGCLLGSLTSSIVYVISSGDISFYVAMRRAYAHFDAWVNNINLDAADVPSFSQRVSGPFDCFKQRVWTTAPCMQPLLEKGYSSHRGLLDGERMKKMFPLVLVNGVHMEQGQVVLESEYENKSFHYAACNGAYEHNQTAITCCCYRIETVYDRLLCCTVGKGSCTSIEDSGDSCGIATCGCCGVGACCCYIKENNQLTSINTGCFGPEGLSCLIGTSR